ncbi:hypothetical protein ATJ93_4573 [Halopiger aswanensis]|uniref:Uncharacterized protein n=1 Tax=Halopiger aswanensis TaxID=148449 RepID=A0A3R7FSS9_9EURY|nr:hypothetical protein ATJ93_4573 [Halopiger aswanensis]
MGYLKYLTCVVKGAYTVFTKIVLLVPIAVNCDWIIASVFFTWFAACITYLYGFCFSYLFVVRIFDFKFNHDCTVYVLWSLVPRNSIQRT